MNATETLNFRRLTNHQGKASLRDLIESVCQGEEIQVSL